MTYSHKSGIYFYTQACDWQGKPIFMSQGYRILAADGKAISETSESLPKCRHSPFCYVPQKQTAIDRQIVKVLLRRYPREAVQKALATLSPIGHKMLMVKERRL